jgi:hypothetical protein
MKSIFSILQLAFSTGPHDDEVVLDTWGPIRE